MNPTAGGDYNYEASGFDGFLSRSIDDLAQVNLDSPGPQTTALPLDRGQQSGGFGNSFRVGNIIFDGINSTVTLLSTVDSAKVVIDGTNRNIKVYDTKNSRVIIGGLPDSSFGWAVSKPDNNVENGFIS